ncbi:MAG: hypothetical protein HY744_10535, partial [Deltaproteobacteria bacterium]|nr:hypothetical protein [Deltaproteobacteria bacterium]
MRTGGHTLVLAVVAAACAGLWARPARAQAAVPPQGEFSAERFVPAIGPRNWLSVAGGRTEGDWAWSGGLVFDYARSPFVLRSCTSATDCSSPATADPEDLGVVEDLFTWHLLASVTKERLQLGVRLPLAFSTGAGFDAATGGSASDGLVAFGLGDPGLEAKVRIWGEPDSAIVLATAADLYAPLGHATASGSHIGNDSPLAGGLRAIMDAQFGRFHLGLNLGALLRRQATLGESSQGSELRYGAAGAMAVGPGIRILAETFGATGFSAQRGTNALEIDAGVEVPALDSGIILTAAMGTGVIRGIGVPLVRVVVGASFSSLRDGAAPKEPAPSAEPPPPPP